MMIPAEFWQSMTEADWESFFDLGGALNREQCLRLWKMLGLKDKPPPKMRVLFKAEDVMRAFPPRETLH